MLAATIAAPFGNLPLWQCAHDKLLTSNLTIQNNAREARARKTIITGSRADFNNSVRRAAPETRPAGCTAPGSVSAPGATFDPPRLVGRLQGGRRIDLVRRRMLLGRLRLLLLIPHVSDAVAHHAERAHERILEVGQHVQHVLV